MQQDSRIIIRVDSVRKKFIQDYAKAKDLTVSRIFRDWIDWLQQRAKKDEQPRSNEEVLSSGEDSAAPADSAGPT